MDVSIYYLLSSKCYLVSLSVTWYWRHRATGTVLREGNWFVILAWGGGKLIIAGKDSQGKKGREKPIFRETLEGGTNLGGHRGVIST